MTQFLPGNPLDPIIDGLNAIADFIRGIDDRIKNTISTVIATTNFLVNRVQQIVSGVATTVFDQTTQLLSSLESRLIDRINSGLNLTSVIIDNVKQKIIDAVQPLLEGIFNQILLIDDRVVASIKTVLASTDGLIGDLTTTITGPLSAAIDAGKAVADTILEQVIGLATSFKEGLQLLGASLDDLVSGATDKVTSTLEEGFKFALGGLLEQVAPDVTQRVDGILKLFEDEEIMPPELRAMTAPGLLPAGIVGGFIAMVMIPFLLAPSLHTIIGPFLELGRQKVNKIARPSLMPLADLISGRLQGVLTFDQLLEDGAKQGFKEADMLSLMVMVKKRPEVGTLLDWWRRDQISEDEFNIELGKSG